MIEIGARYLLIVSLFYAVFSVMFITNGVMRGAGDTMIPLISSAFSLWLIRIPAAAILSQRFGPDGIWWGTPVGWLCGMCFSVIYYRTGRWKRKVVVCRPVAVEMAEEVEPR